MALTLKIKDNEPLRITHIVKGLLNIHFSYESICEFGVVADNGEEKSERKIIKIGREFKIAGYDTVIVVSDCIRLLDQWSFLVSITAPKTVSINRDTVYKRKIESIKSKFG